MTLTQGHLSPLPRTAIGMLLLALVWLLAPRGAQAQDATAYLYTVQPGDTWAALAASTGLDGAALRQAYGHPNRQREPTIGATLELPQAPLQKGQLVRKLAGGMMETAVAHQSSPWTLALRNGLPHPYTPLLYQPLFVPGGESPPRDLPAGFTTLELAQMPAHAGEALALRATTAQPLTATVQLNLQTWVSGTIHGKASNAQQLVALGGTGAFFGSGEPELSIQPAAAAVGQPPPPAWVQPWLFAARAWTFQEITLTGEAAAITQEQIRAERERLFAIWSQVTPQPLWEGPFIAPISTYLVVSSDYGARRSYNGGPYRTYHEGVDYAAYGGTAVTAPAAGRVVLAEFLTVRGGAVIIDHGLGVFSGYYHLSEVSVTPEQMVQPGDILGAVGTTGFSTGNHLHWDLLVGGVWVDGAAWLEQDLAGWIVGDHSR